MSDLASKSAALVQSEARVARTAIGIVADREFEPARAAIPELAGYFDYDDWLDGREGLQIGLAMAGGDATIVPVSLTSFLEWGRLTGAPLGERALDAFAALTLAMRNASVSSVLAVVSARDFATHVRALAAFARHRDYRSWSRRRRAMREKIEASGGRVEELPVRIEGFVDWCACLGGEPSEAMLDRYAQLMLERLTYVNDQ
ncbi:MAG: hypothetical protein ABSC22_01445 [Roseiarcus sp.]